MTKAAARKFVEELAVRAQRERRLAGDEPDPARRERTVGRAEGYADAALLLSAAFHLGSADATDDGRLKSCEGCGYTFCRCASCGKNSCGKG